MTEKVIFTFVAPSFVAVDAGLTLQHSVSHCNQKCGLRVMTEGRFFNVTILNQSLITMETVCVSVCLCVIVFVCTL